MALSSTFYLPIGSYWRLQVEWRATQNHAANTSTITVDVFWMADRSGVGRSYGRSENPVTIKLAAGDNSWSYTEYASSYLQEGQKKLINSYSRTIPHDSQGRLDVDITATYAINTELSGVYYGTRSIADTISLNDIPRESTLAVDASWLAGKQKVISVNRPSSSFSHKVLFKVRNTAGTDVTVHSLDMSSSQTNKTTAFTTAQIETMFQALGGRASTVSTVVLETWSGGTKIGEKTYTGSLSAPLASFLEAPDIFAAGAVISLEAKWYDAAFTHTVRLMNGSTKLKEYTNQSGFISFDTASIKAALTALMVSKPTVALTLELDTFYGSQKVRGTTYQAITARLAGAEPVWGGQPTYADIQSNISALTGDNQKIVSKQSSVRVTIPLAARAIAQEGATMVQYVATLGGKTITKAYSATAAVTFDFGAITASTNQTLTIKASDSRGKASTVTKTVTVLPYNPPGISVSAARANGYDTATRVTLSGTVSNILVNGVEKNAILSARLRYKEAGVAAYGSWITFSYAGFPTFTATDRIINLDTLKAYNFEIEVTDRFGKTSVLRSVASGKPIMMVDDLLESIGFGDFPNQKNEIRINKKVNFGANKFAINSPDGEGGGGAMFLNNGDITGVNGLWFNDWTSNTGEGLLFPKNTAAWGSSDVADYNALVVQNGVLMIDGTPVGMLGTGQDFLWEGGAWMHADQIVTPSRTLANCPSGWILIWSEYVNGAALQAGWQFTFIPKRFGTLSSGGHWIPLAGAGGQRVLKYVYVSNTSIRGHDINDNIPNTEVCLRYVLPM